MGHGEDEQYSEDETQRRFEALVKAQHAARTQEGSSEGARRVKARRQARKEKRRLSAGQSCSCGGRYGTTLITKLTCRVLPDG